MKLVVNGRVQGLADATAYPTSIIGNTKDGKIIFMTADGRQPGYSVGLQIRQMGEILVEMGVENAFLLDGGGSATLYLNGEVVNRASGSRQRDVSDIVYFTEAQP